VLLNLLHSLCGRCHFPCWQLFCVRKWCRLVGRIQVSCWHHGGLLRYASFLYEHFTSFSCLLCKSHAHFIDFQQVLCFVCSRPMMCVTDAGLLFGLLLQFLCSSLHRHSVCGRAIRQSHQSHQHRCCFTMRRRLVGA
jgi:hypothetical protein